MTLRPSGVSIRLLKERARRTEKARRVSPRRRQHSPAVRLRTPSTGGAGSRLLKVRTHRLRQTRTERLSGLREQRLTGASLVLAAPMNQTDLIPETLQRSANHFLTRYTGDEPLGTRQSQLGSLLMIGSGSSKGYDTFRPSPTGGALRQTPGPSARGCAIILRTWQTRRQGSLWFSRAPPWAYEHWRKIPAHGWRKPHRSATTSTPSYTCCRIESLPWCRAAATDNGSNRDGRPELQEGKNMRA